MEENFEKLAHAGDFIGFSKNNDDESHQEQDKVYKDIQEGTKLIVLQEMDFQKILQRQTAIS